MAVTPEELERRLGEHRRRDAIVTLSREIEEVETEAEFQMMEERITRVLGEGDPMREGLLEALAVHFRTLQAGR